MTARESHEPALVDAETVGSVPRMLARRIATMPDHVAFDVERAGEWTTVTTAEFGASVEAIARGLIAAGVVAGERIAVIAPTRYEWSLVDLACLSVGAIVVPAYPTAPDGQLRALLADAGVTRAVVADERLADKVEQLLIELGASDDSRRAWTMDDAPGRDLASLITAGVDISRAEFERRRNSVGLDDLATIVYTSGTTGEPRGARITHRSFIHQVANVAAAYREVVNEEGRTIIFLPLGHVLARALQMICLYRGMRIAHLSDPARAVQVMGRLRPTFLVVVPQVLERIRDRARAAGTSPLAHVAWGRAERVAVAAGEPGRSPWRVRAERAIWDRLVYARVRATLGGHLGYLLSGGAPLAADLCRFFCGLGLPVLEGYGLTESTAPLTGNRPSDIRPGTVGRPIPGVTIRIADDGEILAAGPGIFEGYEGEPPSMGADRWLRTGDLGTLDEGGRLVVTGRSKDVIVTSTGRTIQPAHWERAVERHPLVAHAAMVGDNLPHPQGIIVADLPAATVPTDRDSLAVVDDPAVLADIRAAVEAANEEVAPHERVRTMTVVVAGAELRGRLVTPTFKLRRHELAAVARRDGLIP